MRIQLRPAAEGAKPVVRPTSTWLWTLLAAAVAAAAICATTAWLLEGAGEAPPGTDRAKVRIDAVRTSLAAGAGAGATIGLMLAFRRQRHQEVATVLDDFDATERRITELYLQAANQLGNEKAPVRLAGLYALERLAQDNPAHRLDHRQSDLRIPSDALPPEVSTAHTRTGPGGADSRRACVGRRRRRNRRVGLVAGTPSATYRTTHSRRPPAAGRRTRQ